MKVWGQAFARFAEAGGALCLFAVVVIVTLQIFARTVIGDAFIWPEEISVFLLIYLVFVGAAYNTQKDTHIKVSYFADRMPRRLNLGITLASHLLLLLHLIVLLWSMVPLSQALAISRSPALEWPMLMFFGVIPLAAAVMLILYFFITIKVIRTWVGRVGGKDVPR